MPFVSILAVGPGEDRAAGARRGAGGGRSAASPVGTGPFRFVRWERGKEIVLAANPDYFDGPPKLSRLVFRIFAGERRERVVRRVPERRLSRTLRFPPRTTGRSSPIRAYQYVRRPIFNLRHYGFNTRMKPLDDRRVRQALVYAIDREAIVSEIWLGRHALAQGHPPARDARLQPEAQGLPLRSRQGAGASCPGRLPGRAGLPAAHDLVERALRRDPPRARADPEGPRGRRDHGRVPVQHRLAELLQGDAGAEAADLPPRLVRRRPGPRELPREAVPLRQPVQLHGLREPGSGCAPRQGAGRAGHGTPGRGLSPGGGDRSWRTPS